ncbi:nucleoside-diphosphate sugar epimerase/dehydratase [uncultured Faecalicoccus sp.]|uniref:polysaccharide biosynthesis protein n=1 Tax=uncultured Faecalicoccus sp. TaxID=1971760 RepID=UPI00260AA75F|nr:nucleoside-diphosphate sugar epimerase/dehydratase [uncultured Faecalicoccus sp.]
MTSLYKSMVYQKYRGVLISLFDILVVFGSYVFAFFFDNDFFLNGGMLHITRFIILGMCFVLLLHGIMGVLFQTHKSLWTFTGPSEVIRAALKSICCLLIMLAFSSVAGLFLHKQILIIGETLAFLISLGARLIYRSFRRYALDMERSENAVIVGAGNAGYLMLNEIYRGTSYPYNVVGFLDDMKVKGTIVNGKKVLGSVDDVKEVCEKYDVHHIFIAVSKATREQKQRIIDLCASSGVNTKIMRFTTENDLSSPVHVDDIQIEDLLERPSIDLKTEQIGSYLTNKVVCVTGAGGSIGSELVRQILKFDPKSLILLDINENSLYMLKQEILRGIRKGMYSEDLILETLIVSIRERDEVFKIFHKYQPNVVYHAAAHKHVPLMEDRPTEAIRNNVFGTKNVIDACIENKVERFIMISTDKAVNPTNVMGATKRMTELILQSRETSEPIKMAAVRFGNVLGSNGSVIPIFKEQIKQGGPVTITDKNIQRYFMTIPEAAQLVLQAGYYANHREIFVLDMGKPVKILDLAEKMISLSGSVPYKDIEIKEIGLRPGEKMFEELALEIEKCHRTENKLIFVHEPIDISQETVDRKITTLYDVIMKTDDVSKIKEVLLDAIKD